MPFGRAYAVELLAVGKVLICYDHLNFSSFDYENETYVESGIEKKKEKDSRSEKKGTWKYFFFQRSRLDDENL